MWNLMKVQFLRFTMTVIRISDIFVFSLLTITLLGILIATGYNKTLQGYLGYTENGTYMSWITNKASNYRVFCSDDSKHAV